MISSWLFVAVLQGVVGYVQYFSDVPALLVGIHVAGATILWATTVALVLRTCPMRRQEVELRAPLPAAAVAVPVDDQQQAVWRYDISPSSDYLYEGLTIDRNGLQQGKIGAQLIIHWTHEGKIDNLELWFKDNKTGTITTYYMDANGSTNEGAYEQNDYDFTTWNEKKVYDYLNEVNEYTKQIIEKTYPSKEEIIAKYQTYFAPQLSEKIVDALFVKTADGWKVPDGDSYVFTIPIKGEYEQSDVKIDIQHKFIKLQATYEIGMYSFLQYTIQYDGKPVITEWIMK